MVELRGFEPPTFGFIATGSPAETPEEIRGEGGVFLIASAIVFYRF